jgi:hypothetical protein
LPYIWLFVDVSRGTLHSAGKRYASHPFENGPESPLDGRLVISLRTAEEATTHEAINIGFTDLKRENPKPTPLSVSHTRHSDSAGAVVGLRKKTGFRSQ